MKKTFIGNPVVGVPSGRYSLCRVHGQTMKYAARRHLAGFTGACALGAAVLLTVVPAGFLPTPAFAGAGVAGADIFKVPIEARGWGMGAYSAIADDVGAIAYNPAGLGGSGTREVQLTYLNIIETTSVFSILGAYPLSRWGTLGGMFLYRSVPTIANFGVENRPLAGMTSVEVSDIAFGLYTSFKFSHLLPGVRLVTPLTFGLGIKRATMSIANFSASVTAIDFGFQYSLDLFRFGWVFQNLGGGYTYPGTIEAEADPLPTTMRLSTAFMAYEDSASSLVLAVEDSSYIGVSNKQKFGDTVRTAREYLNLASIGIEYWRLKKMGVRMGYVQPWGTGSREYTGGRGLAFGVSFRLFADYLAYQIDIAYRPLAMGSQREDAGTVSLSIRF